MCFRFPICCFVSKATVVDSRGHISGFLTPPPVRVMGELGEMSECRFHTGYRPIFGGGLLDGQIKKITHR